LLPLEWSRNCDISWKDRDIPTQLCRRVEEDLKASKWPELDMRLGQPDRPRLLVPRIRVCWLFSVSSWWALVSSSATRWEAAMDLFDAIALWGRKYAPQTLGASRHRRFTLRDVMESVDRNAILQLSVRRGNVWLKTVRPDAIRKVKVSLLDDGIAAVHLASDDWYEVYRTAPCGDSSKVRIVARSSDGVRLGEIRMLVGRRMHDYHFQRDPIFDVLPASRG